MYASVEGLALWLDTTVEDVGRENPKVESDLESLEQRMLAYIIPQSPCGENQADAFEKAVYNQYMHEQSQTSKMMMAASGLVSEFRIGNWQATLKKRSPSTDELFPAGLSPNAKGRLLRAGLLYKGGVSLC